MPPDPIVENPLKKRRPDTGDAYVESRGRPLGWGDLFAIQVLGTFIGGALAIGLWVVIARLWAQWQLDRIAQSMTAP